MQSVKFFRLTAPLILITCSLWAHGDELQAARDDGLDASVDLTLESLYRDEAFAADETGRIRWLEDGSGYTILEDPPGAGDEAIGGSNTDTEADVDDDTDETAPAQELVRVDPSSRQRSVLVSIAQLTPTDADGPLVIEDYIWSEDRAKLLIYTNSEKVWRSNSRGDYWLLDMQSGTLRQIGGTQAEASSLMFAKFSPDGQRIAYVRNNEIYAETVADGEIVQLTTDAFATVINGVFDWAYEEEFLIRDGFRWSPDSRRIAFWQLDTSGSRDFTLINNTDELYPLLQTFPYPKVGEVIAAARVGSIAAQGGEVVWADLPGDPRAMYIPRMDWADNSRQIMIQHLNRKQDTINVYYADALSGEITDVLTEQEETFIDFFYDPLWVEEGSAFLWISERNDWRHVLKVSRDGSEIKDLTSGAFDITTLLAVDEASGWVYFVASPDNPTQRYLYRSQLDGSGQMERVTPARFEGSNQYELSTDGRWAVHTHSRFGQPPAVTVISLPDHGPGITLVDNAELKEKLASVTVGAHEFFKVQVQDGLELDGYLIRPEGFAADCQYPIVFHVYGEPWGSTVQDRWDPNRYLFHQLLLQKGFLVASVDSRGTRSPRGKAWRKSIYGAVGTLASRDQSDALKAMLGRWPYIDGGRVGVWWHSGDGTMTLNLMFRYAGQYQVGISRVPVPDQRLYDAIYQERYSGLLSEYGDAYTLNSPINHAANIEGRLLLIHGTGDVNVHYQGTERLINELVRHNKQFDFMSYPNRSHSLAEGDGTTLHLNTMMLNYFDEHLATSPCFVAQ